MGTENDLNEKRSGRERKPVRKRRNDAFTRDMIFLQISGESHRKNLAAGKHYERKNNQKIESDRIFQRSQYEPAQSLLSEALRHVKENEKDDQPRCPDS